ncbi:MAG: hypothetical protein EOP84_33545 [Verrucomicrobiaceae bacterium]|nr:MAG: hypothetical protein EOP84_33545 [Verrucomicrobiaceae bacterium]
MLLSMVKGTGGGKAVDRIFAVFLAAACSAYLAIYVIRAVTSGSSPHIVAIVIGAALVLETIGFFVWRGIAEGKNWAIATQAVFHTLQLFYLLSLLAPMPKPEMTLVEAAPGLLMAVAFFVYLLVRFLQREK